MTTGVQGKRVLVVGLGKSGLAAARLLASRGARVVANDIRSEAQLGAAADELRSLGVELALGEHDPALFSQMDQIVLSPGVPPLAAITAADRSGVPIASEIELASWFIDATVIGITGTNGKSTVTSLVGEMCEQTGRATFVGGNLGTPLCDVVNTPAAQGGYVVVELSSYQLERVHKLHVQVGALLNVTEDHLDRYAAFEDYVAAKANLFRCQRAGDASVIPAGDALCARLAAAGPAQIHKFGVHENVVNGQLVDAVYGALLPVSQLRIRGAHNLANAAAAALCARLAGVKLEPIQQVLSSFSGLPHRMQHVADIADVAYYDDSKATNVGASVAALDGLAASVERIVLIAGGKDKGGDYGPLRARLEDCARAVVTIGEARPIIARALRGADYPVVEADSLEAAVSRARDLAQPGDAVLLAPACASFDMFRSYAHRGEVFQAAVRRLHGGG
jgi:UDP-N-acetylmuramoylalanine--D-glutamate ligase